METNNKKDMLRAVTLGKRPELVKQVVTIEGQEFEVRQPTVGTRSKVMAKARVPGGQANEIDMALFMLWAAIFSVYVPGTDERVFEDTDYDALLEMPTSSFIDSFSEAVMKLYNVEKPAPNSERSPLAS